MASADEDSSDDAADSEDILPEEEDIKYADSPFERFSNWLQSADGGLKDAEVSKQHVNQDQIIYVASSMLKRIEYIILEGAKGWH